MMDRRLSQVGGRDVREKLRQRAVPAALFAIKPLSPELFILGRLLVILRVQRLFFFTTFPSPPQGVGKSIGGGFAVGLVEFLLEGIPLLRLSFWALVDSIRAPIALTA